MKINTKSFLISGLVAGVVILAIGGTMVPVVGNQMDVILAGLGLPPMSVGAMTYFGIQSLIMGFALVFFYAVAKLVIGKGIKTAVLVSLTLWFFVYFFSNAGLVAYGFIPLKFAAMGTLWGLAELLIAGIVGAKLYRDK